MKNMDARITFTKVRMLIGIKYGVLLSISIWMILSTLCYSQTWQRVATNRNAVRWLDKKNVVTVGQYGVIMKSEDAGATWEYIPSGTTQSLYDLYFFNNQHGIAVGDSGKLLWTNDGGNKWEIDSLSIKIMLLGVEFYDSLHGMIVGDSGYIFLTQNGGNSWDLVASQTKNILFDIAYSDSLNAIAVGEMGVITQTTDGGESWSIINNNSTGTLYDIDFYQSNGVIVGYKVGPNRSGIILTSLDKGKVWQEADVANLNIYPEGVKMLDTNRVIAVGGYPRQSDTIAAKIIISNNGGRNWQEIRSGYAPYYYSLRDVDFNNDNKAIIVGEECSILLSTDNGSSWEERANVRHFKHDELPNGNIRFSDAYFFNDVTGIICGGNRAPGIILRTTDQGLTWQTISLREEIRSLSIISEDTLVALPVKHLNHDNTLLKSVDQGSNWQFMNVNLNGSKYEFPSSIKFLNKNEGYFTADSLLYYTNDGGKSWLNKEMPAYRGIINDFDFYNNHNGCVVLESFPEITHLDSANIRRVYRTRNAGDDWELIKELYDPLYSRFNSITMTDEQELWIGYGHEIIYPKSGRIYHTVTGGTAWDSIEVEGAVTDIRFFSDSLGYAVGSNALILKTVDGGETWQREYPWPYELKDSSVIFRGTYLLPGARTLMVYGDGVLVRGTFMNPATSVPTEDREAEAPSVRVVPSISSATHRRIEFPGYAQADQIRVYDLLGAMVYDRVIKQPVWGGEEGVLEVDFGDLASGLYRVVVSTDSGEWSAPLILLR